MRSQRSAAVGAERPCAYGVVRARPLCLSGVRLGPTEVALRPRSPSSQPGASRIEWKFDFSCREWMDCLVECEQLGSAGSSWCNTFSGGQQTRARERVFQRTLQSNTQDTLRDSLQGGTRFFLRVWGLIVHYCASSDATLHPGMHGLLTRKMRVSSRHTCASEDDCSI